MFIEKLSDEQRIEMSKQYLSMIDSLSASEMIDNGRISKEGNELSIYVTRDGRTEEKLTVSDFCFSIRRHASIPTNKKIQYPSILLSVVIESKQESINQKHRKNMYRIFGAEYLNALDKHFREPIELRYKMEISQHEEMMHDIEK